MATKTVAAAVSPNPVAGVLAQAILTALAPAKTAATNIVADPTLENATGQVNALVASGPVTATTDVIATGGNLILEIIALIESKLAPHQAAATPPKPEPIMPPVEADFATPAEYAAAVIAYGNALAAKAVG